MKTATLLRTVISASGANQHIFKLDPPYVATGYDAEDEKVDEIIEFVCVSALFSVWTVETYIFPCDDEGNVVDWGELPGSYKGGTEHDVALAGLGYTIVNTIDDVKPQLSLPSNA